MPVLGSEGKRACGELVTKASRCNRGVIIECEKLDEHFSSIAVDTLRSARFFLLTISTIRTQTRSLAKGFTDED